MSSQPPNHFANTTSMNRSNCYFMPWATPEEKAQQWVKANEICREVQSSNKLPYKIRAAHHCTTTEAANNSYRPDRTHITAEFLVHGTSWEVAHIYTQEDHPWSPLRDGNGDIEVRWQKGCNVLKVFDGWRRPMLNTQSTQRGRVQQRSMANHPWRKLAKAGTAEHVLHDRPELSAQWRRLPTMTTAS